jgi:hypothetical protein
VTESAPVPEIDTSRPHPARIYDYLIGGKDNFAADRETAERVLETSPHSRTGARENRAFLGRAVRYLAADAGLRQFLDIGAGLPAGDNVHEVAQRVAPESRVLYVDNDPLVLAHARALLRGVPEGRTGYIHADLRNPEAILNDPVTRDVLDFSQPIALVLAAVLHFIPDSDNPAEIIATLMGALPSGSYLVASQVSAEHNRSGGAESARTYQSSGMSAAPRDADDFARLAFGGLDLVDPGVVLVSDWRREAPGLAPLPHEVNCYGGVARKP